MKVVHFTEQKREIHSKLVNLVNINTKKMAKDIHTLQIESSLVSLYSLQILSRKTINKNFKKSNKI